MPIVLERSLTGATADSPAAEVSHPLHGRHRVVLIPGYGIGPEVAEATVRVIEATGIATEWERLELNARTIAEYGGVPPKSVLNALGRIRVALKGPVGTPIGGGFQSVNLALRKRLNLFANFRPAGLRSVLAMFALTSLPSYIPIDRVAERLNVTADKLGEFQRLGWIWIVEKEGSHCVPEHQEGKVQFILHLQQVLKLSPQQISGLLVIEGPPYSLNDYDVDRILAEARSSEPDVSVACVHEGAD